MLPLTPPDLVAAVADACHAAGGRALLVGGSVRDHLTGAPIKDWDLEVYGIAPDALERLLRKLGRVDTVGKAFAVFKIHKRGVELDVSVPRRDSKAGPGHKGIVATGDPTMTPAEAARRRDLTVNAILLDVRTAEIVDPVGGLADLQARRLQPVDVDTFLEDPLRALRAVQFVARLGYTPTDDLVDLCRRAALDELPAERVLGEWAKLMLKGHDVAAALAFGRRTGVLARVFPEHPHPEALDAVLQRAVARRDLLDPEGRRFALMLAVWLGGLSRAEAEATLDRLKLYRWMGFPTRDVALAVAAHLDDPATTDAELRWLSTRAEVEVSLRAREARDDVDRLDTVARAAALGILRDPPQPLVQGRDLIAMGIRPGRAMGAALDAVYAQQLDGSVQTAEEARDAARHIAAAS
ncbi:MAG: CCA tRNA nucleotidyltransferase [Alphaproteobacteria bacterium]|nr:CCA tRNA nucleotidyltransferase [Alphaproteobacteria bacterium]